MLDTLAPSTCGARTRQDAPCWCKVLYHNSRCRFHGGLSTGPKTVQGKARSLANLRQNRAQRLDWNKPYGVVYGHLHARYEQAGSLFDSNGLRIEG